MAPVGPVSTWFVVDTLRYANMAGTFLTDVVPS